MRRTPLRRVGQRRKSKAIRRAEVVVAVRARDGSCAVYDMPLQTIDLLPKSALDHFVPWACGGPLDVHEIIPRSVWPDGDLIESNCVLLCRAHHDWVGDHPEDAHAIGLHRFSWERP